MISLDPPLVRGSHGRLTDTPDEGPLFITTLPDRLPPGAALAAVHVKDVVLAHVFG